ncbi:MAG: carbohydrate kinase family protein [Candidatus Thorarchaeota archaeon]
MGVETVSIGRVNIDLMMDIDELPKDAQHTMAKSSSVSIGGSAANFAVHSARLGVKTKLIACVGDDFYGRDAVKTISENGVDTSMVQSIAGQSTGLFFLVRKDKQASFVIAEAGANQHLEEITLKRKKVATARTIHIAGGFPNIISEAARIATSEGIVLSLDPGREAGNIDFSTVLPYVDLLFLNDEELSRYFNVELTETNLKKLGKELPGIVILKRGKDGTMATDGFDIYSSRAFEVSVTDTLGAGDSFAAGFITAWTRSEDIELALHMGNAVAALTIKEPGAQNGPTLKQTYELLSQYGINMDSILRTFR